MSSISTTPLHANGFVVQVHASIMEVMNDPSAMAELKQQWMRSPVMIFRRQCLDEPDLVRFTEYFGRCETSGRKDIQSPYHEQIIYFSTLKYNAPPRAPSYTAPKYRAMAEIFTGLINLAPGICCLMTSKR